MARDPVDTRVGSPLDDAPELLVAPGATTDGEPVHRPWAGRAARRRRPWRSMAACFGSAAEVSPAPSARGGGLSVTAYIVLNGRYFNPDRAGMRYYVDHVQ